MKLNAKTLIEGTKVVLVPYRKDHVEKYHKWMENENLRYLTGSEQLTLAEEYEMQQSWLHDEKKCTFIVLNKISYYEKNNEVDSMIGDVNIFLKDSEEGIEGEISVMVAEENYRRSGFGREAALLMLRYGSTVLQVQKFVAIINLDNSISIKMFEKFGFLKESESQIFNQATLSCVVNDRFLSHLQSKTEFYQELPTSENV